MKKKLFQIIFIIVIFLIACIVLGDIYRNTLGL